MDILLVVIATLVFFATLGLRGLFGYIKNNRANSNITFDWRKFLTTSAWVGVKTAGVGALAALTVVLLWLVDQSGVQVLGIDQISAKTILVGIIIADVAVIGLAIKEALATIFGLNEQQIAQILVKASEASKIPDATLGVDVSLKDGEIVASPETIILKTVKEQLDIDGVDIDHGVEVELAGKGDANTYVEPYRSAAPDTLVDPSTCYNRECVSYTACKIMQVKGAWPPRTGSMNAKEWLYRLPSWGYKEVAAPQEGGKYVGVLPTGTYGHVVWFEYGNTISEYNYNYQHNFGMRAITLSQYRWFEIVAPSNPTPNPEPTPTPTPEPSPVVPNNPTEGANIAIGDSVVAWGVGTSDSYGGGATTRDFPETTMKVIGINNGRYALNQYNTGTPSNLADVTGWFPASQVRK